MPLLSQRTARLGTENAFRIAPHIRWPGGRVGWALFPTVEEAQVFRNLNIDYFSSVSSGAQEGARIALESPLSKPVVQRMVQAFQEFMRETQERRPW